MFIYIYIYFFCEFCAKTSNLKKPARFISPVIQRFHKLFVVTPPVIT